MLEYFNHGIPNTAANYDPNTPKLILGKIRQTANDYRNNHMMKGILPQLRCPGMIAHACNFIRYVDENLNKADKFYKDFFVPYPDLEDDLKWSLRNVWVRFESHTLFLIFT